MPDGSRMRRTVAPPLAMRSLTSAASTGAGTAFTLDGAFSAFGLQVTKTASTKSCLVRLQGSINGSSYFTLAGWASSSGKVSGDIVFVTGKPVLKVRGVLVAKSTASTPVSAWISASN